MRAPPLLRLLSLHIRGGSRTVDWPMVGLEAEGPPRGVPVIDGERCTGCGACMGTCPAKCLTVDVDEEASVPVVDAGQCVRCGLCVMACEEEAVSLTGPSDLAAYDRADLVLDGDPPGERGMGRPSSSLYRRAVDDRGRPMVRPPDLLEDRSRSLEAGKKV